VQVAILLSEMYNMGWHECYLSRLMHVLILRGWVVDSRKNYSRNKEEGRESGEERRYPSIVSFVRMKMALRWDGGGGSGGGGEGGDARAVWVSRTMTCVEY